MPRTVSTAKNHVMSVELGVVHGFQGSNGWCIHDEHTAVVPNRQGRVTVLRTRTAQAAVSDRGNWRSPGGFPLQGCLGGGGLHGNALVELDTASACLGVVAEKSRHFVLFVFLLSR
jgi:hypothetical protein